MRTDEPDAWPWCCSIHTRLRAYHIEVAVELGAVELAGEVQRPEQAAQAGEVVWKLRGVRRVDNLLRVQTPAERISLAALRQNTNAFTCA